MPNLRSAKETLWELLRVPIERFGDRDLRKKRSLWVKRNSLPRLWIGIQDQSDMAWNVRQFDCGTALFRSQSPD
jgi:hypothetical protein